VEQPPIVEADEQVTSRLPPLNKWDLQKGEARQYSLTNDRRPIVLIEDELQMQRFLSVMLQSLGHDLIEAATGQDGLAQATIHNADAVLLALGLPDCDGLEVPSTIGKWS